MPGALRALTTSATETTSSPGSGCVAPAWRGTDEARPARLRCWGPAEGASLPQTGLLPLPLVPFPSDKGLESTRNPQRRQVTIVLDTWVDELQATRAASVRRDRFPDSPGTCWPVLQLRIPAPALRAACLLRSVFPGVRPASLHRGLCSISGPGGLKRN